jgi:DNA (cytosine-5)-methyltransferase 1
MNFTFCVASRGRYNEDGSTSQNYEPRKDYVTNTLTGVQKDNLIIGPVDFISNYKELEREIKPLNGFKVNDFFCGAGGMGLGFKNAGFHITGAWDFDKYAVQSYKHNIDDNVLQADISQMTASDIPYADVWTFGFPCQDISIAGKQAGMVKGVTRSGLFYEIMRLLEETHSKPKLIMAENVKAIKKFLPIIEEEYAQQGYRMIAQLYNSKYWGVPQNRERYFIVGVRNDLPDFEFPVQQQDFIPRLVSILEDNVDEKYYLSDEKALSIIQAAEEGLRVRQATKKGYDVAVAGDSINISHPNSKTRRGRVGKQVSQTLLTGQEQVVVEELQKDFLTKDEVAFCCDASYLKGISASQVGKNRRTHVIEYPKILTVSYNRKNGIEKETDVSHTLSAADWRGLNQNQSKIAVVEIPKYRVRKLTPREYARLQGFPESFEIIVSNTQAYKQFGNAVTVNVSQAIAEQMKEWLDGIHTEKITSTAATVY